MDWAYRFISEYYPARFAKREDFYALQPDTYAELYLKSFERWLHHQPDVFDNAHIELTIFPATELPESNAEQKEIARQRRTEGATLKTIAGELGIEHQTVSRWCKDITPKKQTKQTREDIRQQNRKAKAKQRQDALKLQGDGLSPDDIAKQVKVDRRTIYRWLKKSS